MQRFIFPMLLVLIMPATGSAQSDLQKIGNIIQGIQQLQQQQRQPRNPPPNSGGTAQPYKIAPNSSGNQNTGNFNRPGFFQPQQGNTFPQNNIYPQGQYHPQQTYPQNGSQPHTQHYPQGNIVYPSQPYATPQRTYSNQPITIHCDHDTAGVCNYELLTARGTVYPYQMSAGQKQSLTENTDWSLRYKPTPTSAYKTYRLRGGKSYEIRKSGSIWQLYMQQ